MVDSASHTLAAATDQRRKRDALDKARANYLCSQLRLRLQYAKLKVDHGWQRQTLNEVENLYFRHSQRRKLASKSSLFSNSSTSSIVSTPKAVNREVSTDAAVAPSIYSAQSNGAPQGIPVSPTKNTTSSSSSRGDSLHKNRSPEAPTKTSSTHPNGTQKIPPMASLTAPSMTSTPTHPPNHYPSFEPNHEPRHPYSHYPPHVVHGHFPPSPPSQQEYPPYSPHLYLSKAYVSSSPFPVNGPTPGSPSQSFGSPNQGLTYDSFWSTHASWGAQTPVTAHASSAPNNGSVTAPAPVPITVNSRSGSQDGS